MGRSLLARSQHCLEAGAVRTILLNRVSARSNARDLNAVVDLAFVVFAERWLEAVRGPISVFELLEV